MRVHFDTETEAILTIMQICKCSSEEAIRFLDNIGGVSVLRNKLEDGTDLLELYNGSLIKS